MGSARDWDPILSALTIRYPCLALDLPGHGTHLQAPAGRYSLHGTVEWILEWLDQHHIGHSIPVGYSLGGRIALHLFVQHSRRFPRGVILSAFPGITDANARKKRREWDKRIAHRLQTQPFRAFLKQWYQQPLFGNLNKQVSREFWQQREQNDPLELSRVIQGMGTGRQASLWPALAALQNPILFLAGEKDAKYCRMAHQLYQYNAFSIEIIPNCGHSIHIEQPQKTINAISTFLENKGGQQ